MTKGKPEVIPVAVIDFNAAQWVQDFTNKITNSWPGTGDKWSNKKEEKDYVNICRGMGWGAECVQAVEGGCFSHGSPQCKALAKKGGMGDISGFWDLCEHNPECVKKVWNQLTPAERQQLAGAGGKGGMPNKKDPCQGTGLCNKNAPNKKKKKKIKHSIPSKKLVVTDKINRNLLKQTKSPKARHGTWISDSTRHRAGHYKHELHKKKMPIHTQASRNVTSAPPDDIKFAERVNMLAKHWGAPASSQLKLVQRNPTQLPGAFLGASFDYPGSYGGSYGGNWNYQGTGSGATYFNSTVNTSSAPLPMSTVNTESDQDFSQPTSQPPQMSQSEPSPSVPPPPPIVPEVAPSAHSVIRPRRHRHHWW